MERSQRFSLWSTTHEDIVTTVKFVVPEPPLRTSLEVCHPAQNIVTVYAIHFIVARASQQNIIPPIVSGLVRSPFQRKHCPTVRRPCHCPDGSEFKFTNTKDPSPDPPTRIDRRLFDRHREHVSPKSNAKS